MSRRASGVLERHGRRMARARWIVIPLWLVAAAAAVLLAGRIGDVTTDKVSLPGSEAQAGVELIEAHFSGGREFSEVQPVFRHPTLTVDDAAYRDAVTEALERGAAVVPGTRVTSYFATGSRDLVGQDGHMTFATLTLPLSGGDAEGVVERIREAIGTPDGFLPTKVGGDAAATHDLGPVLEEDLARAELIVLPIALLVLLLFFGSVVSALVPLVLAGVVIVSAFAGTVLFGQAMPIAEHVASVISLVGLAIGIDYALLIVSRFREELRAGRDAHTATARTMATAGRAVLLSGVVVAIGLATLIALPIPFIRSMGVGGMLVPVAAVLASLTLLPALLAVLGRRVDSLRVYPRRWRLRDGAVWGPVARAVTGRAMPVAFAVLAAVAALATEFPSLGTDADPLADTPRVEAVEAGLLVRAELGGAANPNVYVVDSGRPGGVFAPATAAALDRLADDLRARRDVVAGVTWPRDGDAGALRRAGLVDSTGRYALMNVAPHGDEMSPSARRLNALMGERADAFERAVPGTEVLVTGAPAISNEFDDALHGSFPYLVAGVLLLTFLALTLAFRTWRVPLVAVVMSGLTLLATYGLLHLVFQRGVGAEWLGLEGEVRGVAGWVPVFVFAFLFGISMDYQVFLLERVREARARGAGNREAIVEGLRGSGRVIACAAVIMVVAFAGFVTGRDVQMKEFGFALAAAVAMDALLVRCLVVPALLRLGGERNWGRARRSRAAEAAPTIAVDR